MLYKNVDQNNTLAKKIGRNIFPWIIWHFSRLLMWFILIIICIWNLITQWII